MQFLQLMELLVVVQRPQVLAQNPRHVLDTYVTFLEERFSSKGPLFSLVSGSAAMVDVLREFRRMADLPNEIQHGERANYLPAPEYFLLNQACLAVNEAFGGVCCYLVGSALVRRDYRDVDIRCILEDEHFDKLFPGAGRNPQFNALWSLMCSAVALMLKQQTGLPIDFQIQRQTQANENFTGARSALGIFLGYPGGG